MHKYTHTQRETDIEWFGHIRSWFGFFKKKWKKIKRKKGFKLKEIHNIERKLNNIFWGKNI